MTAEEILRETAKFYNLGNRATNGGECYYIREFSHGTKHCAFGRCMTPEALEKYGKINATVYGLIGEAQVVGPDPLLQEKYHGHSDEFWRDVQMLHDREENWTETGLSEWGEKLLEDLILKWA